MGCDSNELSVVITDDEQIQMLNKRYRKIDTPTNVLAFPMQEGKFGNITPGLLGDIVISCDTAQIEADKANISLAERFSQILVHGILHLTGFDHETGENDAKKMENKSLEILRKIEDNQNLNTL